MIGNITVTRDSEAAMRTYTKARSFELTSLGKLEGGDTILDGSLFPYMEASQGKNKTREIFLTNEVFGLSTFIKLDKHISSNSLYNSLAILFSRFFRTFFFFCL